MCGSRDRQCALLHTVSPDVHTGEEHVRVGVVCSPAGSKPHAVGSRGTLEPGTDFLSLIIAGICGGAASRHPTGHYSDGALDRGATIRPRLELNNR